MTDTLRIELNGEARAVAAGTTLQQLVEQLEIPSPRFAVELNRRILSREEFDRALAEGDKIEIVTFVGGG